MFLPKLQLIPEDDGEYSLLSTTPVPSSFYKGLPAVKGAPKSMAFAVGKGAQNWQLPIRYEDKNKKASPKPRNVYHRIRDLKLNPGAVVVVHVVLDSGVVLGTASITLASGASEGRLATVHSSPVSFHVDVTAEGVQRVPASQCMQIVVNATPKPGKFTNPGQALQELGVVDTIQTKLHASGIEQGMKAAGGSIDPNKIFSGPSVSVGTCTASVFQGQDGSL